MSLGTIYITVLRLIHIFAAFTWIGGGIFVVSVLLPTVAAAGQDGGRFMLRLAGFGRMARVLPGAAVITVAAGLLLYWPTSGGLNPGWLTSGHGITLTIGALLGITAMLHAIFATAPISNKMGVVANDILGRQGPPPPELLQQAQALGAKLQSGAMVSVGIGAAALFFMAAAQTI